MSKITLDRNSFKTLASDTRLDILKTLDGNRMSLGELSESIDLNKATLHEHLSKLHEAGLVKRKKRPGHKWVYYKLSWKGECLLHPENTRIVVLFTTTFIAFWLGVIELIQYVEGKTVDLGYKVYSFGENVVMTGGKGVNATSSVDNVNNSLSDSIPIGKGNYTVIEENVTGLNNMMDNTKVGC